MNSFFLELLVVISEDSKESVDGTNLKSTYTQTQIHLEKILVHYWLFTELWINLFIREYSFKKHYHLDYYIRQFTRGVVKATASI